MQVTRKWKSRRVDYNETFTRVSHKSGLFDCPPVRAAVLRGYLMLVPFNSVAVSLQVRKEAEPMIMQYNGFGRSGRDRIKLPHSRSQPLYGSYGSVRMSVVDTSVNDTTTPLPTIVMTVNCLCPRQASSYRPSLLYDKMHWSALLLALS